MKEKEKDFISRTVDTVGVALVLAWVLNFLLTTRIGVFLLVTAMFGMGLSMIVAGLFHVTEDFGWCFVASGVITFVWMAAKGVFDSPKQWKDEDEDEDEDE